MRVIFYGLHKIKKMEQQNNPPNIKEIVKVSCIEKDYVEYDYEEFITYKFEIKNTSDKTIRAVKGSVVFNNIFDEKIQSLSFVYDQPIEPGKWKNWNANTEFNPYIEEDRVLRDKSLKDLNVVWNPEKIIFLDGSKLE